MRLASFAVETRVGEQTRVGVVADDGDTYLDVTTGHAALLDGDGEDSPLAVAEAAAPPAMVDFLDRGDRAMDAARRVADAFGDDAPETWNGRRVRYDAADVRLLSPVPRPLTLRDAMVYEEHTENSFGEDIPDVWYDLPVYYKGNPTSVVAPDTDVAWPDYSEEMDYELEIAAVIGKQGRNLSPEDAGDHIAGYTVFNDFSARDMQFHEMEASLGPAKGKDFANGLGPYLTTTDAIDIRDVEMAARVNGETWSEGDPGTMHHTFEDIVAHVSDSETIYPGEVIGSGTVGRGCGLELDRLLSEGDEVELEVEGIGTLRHRIVRSD
jgi:2-keto-4-pentenoate hydratase/2-oxohepta-3-ene-1,7-dioic acid hydratase in catechol pathway